MAAKCRVVTERDTSLWPEWNEQWEEEYGMKLVTDHSGALGTKQGDEILF